MKLQYIGPGHVRLLGVGEFDQGQITPELSADLGAELARDRERWRMPPALIVPAEEPADNHEINQVPDHAGAIKRRKP